MQNSETHSQLGSLFPTNLDRRAHLRLISLQVTPHKASEAGKANTLLPPLTALVNSEGPAHADVCLIW